MNNLFRALIAGYGAKKLGGGCFSTILVFIVIWVLLGQCGAAMPPVESTTPPEVRVEALAPPAPAPPAVALVPAG